MDLYDFKRPVILADLSALRCSNYTVALGNRHLEEGSAKAVEMIRRGLDRERGLRAFRRNRRRKAAEQLEMISLMDPYFLANGLYNSACAASGANGTLDEFIALVDLAMMLDEYILNWQQLRRMGVKERNKNILEIEAREGPINVFFMLLTAFAEHHKEIPRIELGYRSQDLVAFQNGLLRFAGAGVDVLGLTNSIIHACDGMFSMMKKHRGESSLMKMYRGIFRASLNWRAKVLGGGPPAFALFYDLESVLDGIMQVIPAFHIGGMVYSPHGGMREGIGVGIDMLAERHLRDLVNSIMFGNAPCRLDRAHPRNCTVDHHELCNGIGNAAGDIVRCDRESMLKSLMELCGVRRIDWEGY